MPAVRLAPRAAGRFEASPSASGITRQSASAWSSTGVLRRVGPDPVCCEVAGRSGRGGSSARNSASAGSVASAEGCRRFEARPRRRHHPPIGERLEQHGRAAQGGRVGADRRSLHRCRQLGERIAEELGQCRQCDQRRGLQALRGQALAIGITRQSASAWSSTGVLRSRVGPSHGLVGAASMLAARRAERRGTRPVPTAWPAPRLQVLRVQALGIGVTRQSASAWSSSTWRGGLVRIGERIAEELGQC